VSFVWSPPADPAAVADLAARLTAAGLAVQTARPLGPLTTFGVGGAAAVFVEPVDQAALTRILELLAPSPESAVPMLVLGKGSNLLVADAGFPGLALRLGRGFTRRHREGDRIEVGAGVAMPQLAAWTARSGLTGLEFAAAIPASVGGSVRMNAGAHSGEVADVLAGADLASPEQPHPRRVAAAELGLGYRRSALPPRTVVTAAEFRLRPDDPVAIGQRLADHRAWRRHTQPLRARSCGSTFTNPPGDSAGRLIEAAGLKGLRVGGAQISDRHANFIVVDPGTRAADVLGLLVRVQRAVREAGGPELRPEVRAVGDFGGLAGP